MRTFCATIFRPSLRKGDSAASWPAERPRPICLQAAGDFRQTYGFLEPAPVCALRGAGHEVDFAGLDDRLSPNCGERTQIVMNRPACISMSVTGSTPRLV